MQYKLVIAKAHKNHPVKMILVESFPGVAFLSAPDRLKCVLEDKLDPVGFPAEDIFEYDEAIFNKLSAEWEADAMSVSWSETSPVCYLQN